MTIREALERRSKRLGLVAALAVLVSLALVLFDPHRQLVALWLIALAVVASAVLALTFSLRCPNCATNLGPLFNRPTASFRARAIRYCPGCATDLDTPMPAPSHTEGKP